MVLTIPGYLCFINSEDQRHLDTLLQNFGNARRRAYQLKRKGFSKAVIEQLLQRDHYLNSRYAKDAYFSIKDLPVPFTFGGVRNQRLRETQQISREEYRQRRNSYLLSRGDKSKQGNLNLRLSLETRTLRITTGDPTKKWIFPEIFIPKKYLERYGAFLDGTHIYMIILKRCDHNQGYDLRITIQISQEITERRRILALDVNAGHTAFSVLDKHEGTVLAIGTLKHHETQYTRKGRREALLHKLVDKIGNLAHHYQAEVVTGKLNTRKFKSHRRVTRAIRQMPQYKFRQILAYKLPLRGIPVRECSEAYTSMGGAKLSQFLGLDVHKGAAVLFALKVINYPLFRAVVTLLTRDPSEEGDGSLRRKRRRGSGLTAPNQNGSGQIQVRRRMKFWWAMRRVVRRDPRGGYSAIPGSWGHSFVESLKSSFAYHEVRIC